jgi:hypothetical protein
MKEEFGSVEISYVKVLESVDVKDVDDSKIAEAVEAVKKPEVAVVVFGERGCLFGRGTSGEDCDAETSISRFSEYVRRRVQTLGLIMLFAA